jgi:quercetin dioxygenase-like cupin family protein
MGIVHTATFAAMDQDPDDYRPSSSWALTVDPDGRSHLSVIRERIGVGDRIPRHWHDVDEVVLYTGGEAVVHLEGADRRVEPGATVFIPAGAIHGTVNAGSTPVEITAVFPATSVRMDLVERNPGPGTEGALPRAVTVDMATGAVTDHGPTDLSGGRPQA